MYGFLLGREFKISVAEIFSVFPNISIEFHNKEILIASNITKEEILEKAQNIWGTIKIISLEKTDLSLGELILDRAPYEGKFRYWVNIYWVRKSLRDILVKVKKKLKNENISSRFTNKDFKNLSSAQIIAENLVERESDFNAIYLWESEEKYFWETIWVQNIDEYSKRDYSKDRDMQIGMLPPKLSQMMINLSGGKTIYDPFVGLGTVLIESLYMWNTHVYWSDLNEKMVETSLHNCKEVANKLDLNATIKTQKLNAKFIHESEYFQEDVDAIVTEWYLWEIMTKKNISVDRIMKQRQSLEKIYSAFFENLSKMKYSGTLVISFPFWDVKWKYVYFEEVYTILQKYCNIQDLFPANFELKATKSGSLLYKRNSQLVWREIFKLTMK